jgi:hypothetical protein
VQAGARARRAGKSAAASAAKGAGAPPPVLLQQLATGVATGGGHYCPAAAAAAADAAAAAAAAAEEEGIADLHPLRQLQVEGRCQQRHGCDTHVVELVVECCGRCWFPRECGEEGRGERRPVLYSS